MFGKITPRMLLCITVLCGAPLIASAQPQQAPSMEAFKAARELASTTPTEVIVTFVTKATAANWPQVESALRSKNPRIDANTLAELRREFEILLANAVATDLAEGAYIYAHYFTEQELRELIAFYRTPTGAKTLALLPYIQAEFEHNLSKRQAEFAATAREKFGAILRKGGFAQ